MLTMCNMIFAIVGVIILNRITPRETFIKKATIKMIAAKKNRKNFILSHSNNNIIITREY
jgi:hypothetical protein